MEVQIIQPISSDTTTERTSLTQEALTHHLSSPFSCSYRVSRRRMLSEESLSQTHNAKSAYQEKNFSLSIGSEILTNCNRGYNVLFDTLLDLIDTKDIELINLLKNECVHWKRFKQEYYFDELKDAFFLHLDQNYDRIEESEIFAMFTALFLKHPGASLPTEKLGSLLNGCANFGSYSFFCHLKNSQPAWELITTDQLLRAARFSVSRSSDHFFFQRSPTYRSSLIEWKKAIFTEIASHPALSFLSMEQTIEYLKLLGQSEIFSPQELDQLFASVATTNGWKEIQTQQIASMIKSSLNFAVHPHFSLSRINTLLNHPQCISNDPIMLLTYRRVIESSLASLHCLNERLVAGRLEELTAIMQHPLFQQLTADDLNQVINPAYRLAIPDEILLLFSQHSEWHKISFDQLQRILNPNHSPLLNLSQLKISMLITHPSWEHAEKSTLVVLAQKAIGQNDPLAITLMQKIATHPLWYSFTQQDIHHILNNIGFESSDVERAIAQILSTHPFWSLPFEEALNTRFPEYLATEVQPIDPQLLWDLDKLQHQGWKLDARWIGYIKKFWYPHKRPPNLPDPLPEPSLAALFSLLPLAKNIRVIDFGCRSSLGVEEIMALAKALPLTDIHEINLMGSPLSSRAMSVFTECLRDSKVAKLNLFLSESNQVEILGRGLKNSSVEELRLFCSAFQLYSKDAFDFCSSTAAAIFREGVVASNLRFLNFHNCNLEFREMSALVAQSQLETLYLKELRTLGSEEACQFAEGLRNSKLKKLILEKRWQGKEMGPKGAVAIFRAISSSPLEELSLQGYDIKEAIPEIATLLEKTSLKKMYLEAGAVNGNSDAIVLAKALAECDIEELRLSFAGIDDAGVDLLLEHLLQAKSLRMIDLTNNPISRYSCKKLQKALEEKDIQFKYSTPWIKEDNEW